MGFASEVPDIVLLDVRVPGQDHRLLCNALSPPWTAVLCFILLLDSSVLSCLKVVNELRYGGLILRIA